MVPGGAASDDQPMLIGTLLTLAVALVVAVAADLSFKLAEERFGDPRSSAEGLATRRVRSS